MFPRSHPSLQELNPSLILPPIYANMGCHMKTTIEIADDLFARARRLAQQERTTFRALTEEGLRRVLAEKGPRKGKSLPPLVTVRGTGMTEEFQNAPWEKIRDEIYRGR